MPSGQDFLNIDDPVVLEIFIRQMLEYHLKEVLEYAIVENPIHITAIKAKKFMEILDKKKEVE